MAGAHRLQRVYRATAIFWLTTTLLVVAANLLAVGWLSWRGAEEPGTRVDTAPLAQAYPNLSREELLQLSRESTRDFMYEAFTQFRERPGDGRFVHIDENGFRRSKDQGPWPPDKRYFNVFVFGGSTTFGYGVVDEDTVASTLQDAMRGLGLPREPRVYNFGRGAYYSSQERALFEKLLVAGNVPDAAIFLDGLNDFMYHDDRPAMTVFLEVMVQRFKGGAENPWAPALATLPVVRAAEVIRGEIPPVPIAPPERRRAGPQTAPAKPQAAPGKPPPLPPALRAAVEESEQRTTSNRVINRWTSTKRIIEAMAATYGTRVLFVWQPVPMYKYDLTYHTAWKKYRGHQNALRGYPVMAEYVAAHPMGSDFVWCADIQQNAREMLYVDQVHYAPRLQRMVADCIVDAVRQGGLFR
jgi:hypothetical protein